MDLYHEMRKYRTGFDDEGNSRFSIPLEADEDGLLGRECPNDECATKYFKVSTEIPDAFRPMRRSRGGLFDISVEVKPGSLPAITRYVEEKRKEEVACGSCGYKYAVYGISLHCPLCGKGALREHLGRSCETVRILAREAEDIGAKYGKKVGEIILENAVEDVVSLSG